jgi:hypothetical protein
MSPGRRQWVTMMIERWGARAAELRVLQEGGGRGLDQRATAVEDLVAALQRELDASPEPAPVAAAPPEAELAELERRLARCQPYMHPIARVMINTGEIIDRHRHGLAVRIAELRGEDPPPAPVVAPKPPMFMPPPEVVPFTMGPQLAFL